MDTQPTATYLTFDSSDDLDQHLRIRGYEPGSLQRRIEDGFFDNASVETIASQLIESDIPWVRDFRATGGFSGPSTHDVTLMIDREPCAIQYATNSIFMTSYREIVCYVFEWAEMICQSNLTASFALPAGGFPYYLPAGTDITVFDRDASLAESLDHLSNVSYFLGDVLGDVFNLEGDYDVICCMGFAFYLTNEDSIRRLVEVFYQRLNAGGYCVLNYILPASVQGRGIENFENAARWNMELIMALNSEPSFTGFFFDEETLRRIVAGRFSIEQTFYGTLGVHGVSILKRLD